MTPQFTLKRDLPTMYTTILKGRRTAFTKMYKSSKGKWYFEVLVHTDSTLKLIIVQDLIKYIHETQS